MLGDRTQGSSVCQALFLASVNRQGTEAMGSKAKGEMSAKPFEAPSTSNMYRCLKQQVQHLKVKKRSMATVSIHG